MANPMFKLEKVKRQQCKASIMIEGLTGTGKTGLALLIARALTDDFSEVAAIDTENKSINLYADLKTPDGMVYNDFVVGQLTPEIGFKPTNYLMFREHAKKQGIKACIFDSISHAWMYSGGVLDLVSKAKAKNDHYKRDKYAAWGDEEVVEEKNRLMALIRDDIHMITTVRVKEKMEYGTDDKGKTTLVSLGEQQIQQADLKYEPDLVLHMVSPGSKKNYPTAKVIKTRYAFLEKDEIYTFTPALLKQMRDYLDEGANPEELLEQQRQEYITAVTDKLDTEKTLQAIWGVLKEQAGHKDTKLEDLPLEVVRSLYIRLTS